MKNHIKIKFLYFVLIVTVFACKPNAEPVLVDAPSSQGLTVGSSNDNPVADSTKNEDDPISDEGSTSLLPESPITTTTTTTPITSVFRLSFLDSGIKINSAAISDNQGKINCNNTTAFQCSATYPAGTAVTVSTPNNISVIEADGSSSQAAFGGRWICNGSDVPNSNSLTLTVTVNQNLSCGGYYIFTTTGGTTGSFLETLPPGPSAVGGAFCGLLGFSC